MNKVQLSKYNHWNRKLWRKHSDDWDALFSTIENSYLKIKVACLVLWDSTDTKLVKGRDFGYLRKLSNQYRPNIEEGFKQEELYDELIRFGYPKKLAVKRSTPPKVDYGRKR